MGKIVQVKESGEIVGAVEYALAHPRDSKQRGIRHLSSNVFIFRDSSLTEILLTKRNPDINSGGKINVCIGGHNDWLDYSNVGEKSIDSALRELKEEIFYNNSLPSELQNLQFISAFPKNLRINDLEIVSLYTGIYYGPFYKNPSEVSDIFFKTISNVKTDIIKNPEKYVKSAELYLDHLCFFIQTTTKI